MQSLGANECIKHTVIYENLAMIVSSLCTVSLHATPCQDLSRNQIINAKYFSLPSCIHVRSFYMFYQEILAVLMLVCISCKTRHKKLAKDSRYSQQFESASSLNAQLLFVIQIGEYISYLLYSTAIVKSII